MQMEPSEGFEVVKTVPCPSLPYDTPGTTYTLVRMPEDNTLGNCLIISNLRLNEFITKSV